MGRDGRETIGGLPRFHVRPEQVDGDAVCLSREQAHKLQHVLRLRAGAEIAVLPGDDSYRVCRLVSCCKDGAKAEVLASGPLQTESPLDITLCQAVPKAGKLDTIVRSCTGAGVVRFAIYEAERSVARWPADRVADRVARLQAIAHEESELAFRARVPEVAWRPSFAALVADLAPREGQPRPILLYEGSRNPLHCVVAAASPVTLILGPEGGFSENEVEAARAAGCVIASLGPRILRTEHAGLYAVAALQALYEMAGSWSPITNTASGG